jgi:predicted phosphate transport protein (TIGR00153 family)
METSIPMGLLNFLPKEEQYFALFSQMTSYIYDAANALVEMLNDGSGVFEQHSKKIKKIEHECDELTHSISTRLNKSFITPFDREDIYLMSSALDDIVDLIDDAARAMVIYDVQESTNYARRMADVIMRASIELHEVVSKLAKPEGISERLVRLHSLENEGDEIYHTALAELFRSGADPLTVIKWKDIYEKLEAAVDRCENVANIIESVIIKHS